MSIYERKYQWKLGLLITALMIIAISLWSTNQLASKLAEEERKKVDILAQAFMEMKRLEKDTKLSENLANTNIQLTQKIIINNETIPLILTDGKGKITGQRNISGDDLNIKKDSIFFKRKLQEMGETYEPIEIMTKYKNDKSGQMEELVQRVYYAESKLLSQLRIYPFIQLGIIAVFLSIAYVAFSTARRAEQNKVWLGMAKETAHQLGTPLSSMVGWLEILKTADDPSGTADMVSTELSKDVNRLELIAERFSKIGSKPELVTTNVIENVEKTLNYVKRRASNRVEFEYNYSETPIHAQLNTILFDWVLENLFKNALDAMGGQGKVSVQVEENDSNVIIQVTDTGKGIPKSKFKTIFEPGFSTKKRGWGLGLSLSKRIVEIYHAGKIFVSGSVPNKATTFCIELPKEGVSV